MTARTPDKPLSPDMLKSGRNVSNMLALWALCGERVCRKGGQCGAARPTCLKTCFDLVPTEAGAWVFALFRGKEAGLSFDESLAEVPDDLAEAWCEWHEALSRATGRPSYKPRRRAS